MYAHKVHITIAEDYELRLRLPQDFPAGEAEVIVLSTRQKPAAEPGRVERVDRNAPEHSLIRDAVARLLYDRSGRGSPARGARG